MRTLDKRSLLTVGVVSTLGISLAGCRNGADEEGVAEQPAKSPVGETETTTGIVGEEERGEAKSLADTDITEAIRREMRHDMAVDASKINVSTTTGIVELTGTVDNALAKERATRHAEVVRGVRSVANRIQVDPPKVPDQQLADEVERALALDPATDSFEIDVEAKDGIITLSGTVDSWQEMKLAERVALGTRGVSEVKNGTEVVYAEERSDPEIQKDIRSRLRWDVLVDHALIDVDVEDGKVSLRGTVGSAAERSRAYFDAWVHGTEEVDTSELDVKWWARDEALRKNKYTIKSDAEVAQAIKDAAIYDPRVNSFNIDVDVDNGLVTLGGVVTSRKAKMAAEQLAENTVGATAVSNNLRIETDPPSADATIRRSVEAALAMNPHTEAYEMDVTVQDGVVTLTGAVDSYFEKAEAEDVVSGILGVKSVDNELGVTRPNLAYTYDPYLYPYYPYSWTHYTPPETNLADARLAQEVKDEMYWSPFVDADEVSVIAEDGEVTLVGTVDSWHERSSATENAFEAGAIIVDNRLMVR